VSSFAVKQISGLSGSDEEQGMFMIKQALTTKLKVVVPGADAAQREGLIQKLKEARIIAKGRVVGISGDEEENKKLKGVLSVNLGSVHRFV
jgi:hypothetical protein